MMVNKDISRTNKIYQAYRPLSTRLEESIKGTMKDLAIQCAHNMVKNTSVINATSRIGHNSKMKYHIDIRQWIM